MDLGPTFDRVHVRCGVLAWVLALASAAAAQPVAYQFTGTVVFVTDGSNSTIDLTNSFSPGQMLHLTMTVERSTPAGSGGDPSMAFYPNAVTQFGFTIGTYVCTGDAMNISTVVNDLTPPGPGTPDDMYDVTFSGLTAPAIGSAQPVGANLSLIDNDGIALSSNALPLVTSIAEFELRTFDFQFTDGTLQVGLVTATLNDVITSVRSESWAYVKAMYR
jgi:hypothetical protein